MLFATETPVISGWFWCGCCAYYFIRVRLDTFYRHCGCCFHCYTPKKKYLCHTNCVHTHTHTKMRHSLFLHSFFFSFFFNRDYTKSTLCTKSTYNLYCSFIITIFVAGAVVAAAAAHFIQHFKLILLFISSICLFFVFEDLFYFLGMVYFALFELPLERSFVNLMNSQNYDLLYEFECWHYRNEIVLKNLVECPGKK